jgi:hypothetical protein
MLQVWVIHHLRVIGEAARSVSQSLQARHPEVPWPQIVGLRNILVHEYFGLNLHQVWTMTQKDLPQLEEQVQHIRSQISAGEGSRGRAAHLPLSPPPAASRPPTGTFCILGPGSEASVRPDQIVYLVNPRPG